MMRYFTLLCCYALIMQTGFAQVYVDQFDNDDPAFMGGAAAYSFEEANNELTVTGTDPAPFDVFTYQLHDPAAGESVLVDATGNNKIFVRAKASNVGTQLRMDLQDVDGFATSLAGITKTLTTDFMVLEFDFTDLYADGGFGGTPCTSGPCDVDGTQISQLLFFVDPGVGGFNGTVIIDYIAFGEEPDGVIMSDIFQDHFDMDSSINSFTYLGEGYSIALSGNSEVVITGDGSTPIFDPLTYIFRNPNTLDTIDIDAASGDNKMYVKVKSSVPNTALRMDLQDIDGFVTTQGSITKIVGTDYTVLEYDFTGTYFDLGFGGTPCTESTAPCPVDPTRIADILLFIEPGLGMFLGDLTIDYISFGIPLEPAGPAAELVYEDHFNNEMLEFTSDVGGYTMEETGTEWIFTGDGTSGPFTAISYLLHDKMTGEEIFLDMEPGQNKVFLKARTDAGSVPLRLDLIDTTGFLTSQTSLTKIISEEYATYEFDFTGGYFDGGFGGSPCETGPCEVDSKAITQMLLYIDPVQGGYAGQVFIDFVSIGQPLGDDAGPPGILNYSDQMDDNTALFISDMTGITSSFENDEWTLVGDGTGGAFAPTVYTLHNDAGDMILADAVGSGDILYMRAKSTIDATELRVDLQDSDNFVTNLNAQSVNLTTDYNIYEFNYNGAYLDGAFGGSPCTDGPCSVNGERIANMQVFILPTTGGFSGEVTIDWISFGNPLVGVQDVERLNSIVAFPNPVSDQLTLDFDLPSSSNVRYEIYNSFGQLAMAQSFGWRNAGNNQENINLSVLSEGVYFLSLQIDGAPSGSLRFIKK